MFGFGSGRVLMVEVNKDKAQQWLADYLTSGSEAAFESWVEALFDQFGLFDGAAAGGGGRRAGRGCDAAGVFGSGEKGGAGAEGRAFGRMAAPARPGVWQPTPSAGNAAGNCGRNRRLP